MSRRVRARATASTRADVCAPPPAALRWPTEVPGPRRAPWRAVRGGARRGMGAFTPPARAPSWGHSGRGLCRVVHAAWWVVHARRGPV